MSHHIESFFAAWGEPDAEARATTLNAAVAPAFTYADPRTQDPIHDGDALAAYVGMFSQYAPGATAQVVNLANIGDAFRATVEFAMPDGKKQLGQYFGDTDETGRITRMTGFVGLGEPE